MASDDDGQDARVSLRPLDPRDALKALLRVKLETPEPNGTGSRGRKNGSEAPRKPRSKRAAKR